MYNVEVFWVYVQSSSSLFVILKLLEANSKLTLAQSQQMREVQQWKEKVSSSVPKEQLSHLQNRLVEEQQKVQQLQERLRFHAEQTNRQLAVKQVHSDAYSIQRLLHILSMLKKCSI